MLSEKQKQDQLQAEIGLHLIRTLLPIDEQEKTALQPCYQALKELHEQKMESAQKADALNSLLAPLKLHFSFITDKNAKEYIKNNPNVFQVTWIGAQVVCYPWPGVNPELTQLKVLVDSIFEEVNKKMTSEHDGLMVIQRSLGAGLLLLKFKRGGSTEDAKTMKNAKLKT